MVSVGPGDLTNWPTDRQASHKPVSVRPGALTDCLTGQPVTSWSLLDLVPWLIDWPANRSQAGLCWTWCLDWLIDRPAGHKLVSVGPGALTNRPLGCSMEPLSLSFPSAGRKCMGWQESSMISMPLHPVIHPNASIHSINETHRHEEQWALVDWYFTDNCLLLLWTWRRLTLANPTHVARSRNSWYYSWFFMCHKQSATLKKVWVY